MGFLTPLLLAGAAFVAVPIILHLIMRRQPQQLVFPALRFVLQRQEANRRRLQLRHWFLLALRCGLIAGLAMTLARPILKGSGLRGKEGAPLAVALVVDNSLRMQYVHQNHTRLDDALRMAKHLVKKLPENSEIAVLDRRRSGDGFTADLETARSRLEHLEYSSNPRPLDDTVIEAIKLVAQHPDHRQEVLLFSDLSLASFSEPALEGLQEALAESPDVRVYVVDVGVEQTTNASIGPLKIRRSMLRPGEPLHIEAPVKLSGTLEPPLVELHLIGDANQTVKRGQQVAPIDEAGLGQATFELANLPLGVHQGYVCLAANDPLEPDNTRYFTVEVRPPANVLLLGERSDDTLFLREALQPSLNTDQGAARFNCEVGRFSNAADIELSDFDAICLLDPPPLSDSLWQALVDYADQGAGVGIFLGNRAKPDAFNTQTAQNLLPGLLKWKSRDTTYFRPRLLAHPALAGLRDYAEEIPWSVFPVWQYWEFGELAGDAHVVARFANHQPALIERSSGMGRVLTFATALSDPLEPVGREPWNVLPTGHEPWPFVALANQLVGYLAQSEEERFDYRAGETVSIRLAPRQRVSNFVLYHPDGRSMRRTLPPGDEAILISTTDELGNYRVASGGHSRRLQRGFSVNASSEISELLRIDPKELADALSTDQVQIARTLGDVQRYVDIGRSGRELFPWAISLVALIWSAEHLLANRFYRGAP